MRSLHTESVGIRTRREAARLPPALCPLAGLLRGLPGPLHTRVLCALVQPWLGACAERLQPLAGRRVELQVLDTGNRWVFQVRGGRVHPARGAARAADVRIRGRLLDFLRLALGTEDPDTLFFQRRLCLEGDTATGLQLKNLLDSLELDWRAWLRAALGPDWSGRVIALVERNGVERVTRTFIERMLSEAQD